MQQILECNITVHGIAVSAAADVTLNNIVSETGGLLFSSDQAADTNAIADAFRTVAQMNTGMRLQSCLFLLFDHYNVPKLTHCNSDCFNITYDSI